MLPGSVDFKDKSIRAILPFDDKFLIVTMANGLYSFGHNSFEKVKTKIDNYLKEEKIVTAIMLEDGNYAFGMFSSGLLIMNEKGDVLNYFNKETGLQSDLIINIMQDTKKNYGYALRMELLL